MITPSFGITATERVLPRLALDFTTAALDPRVTFTRTGNTATVTNSSGVIVGINADLPRFDFDPVTLVCRGLLIEESRTNALLNSLIDGTSLATQSMTVTAAARTLSFYGTGQVVLSGAASATVTGTGAYPTRTTLTFTPSAGTLTLTVTGTVQFAQLEVGAFATSYIPTEASALTRNADVATMTGTNFSNWYNASAGTLSAEFDYTGIATTEYQCAVTLTNNTGANYLTFFKDVTTDNLKLNADAASSNIASLGFSPAVVNTVYQAVTTIKADDIAAAVSASAVQTDTNTGGVLPTIDRLHIGILTTGILYPLNGHMRKIEYWPQRLTNAEVQAFSKI
jgi:hypothetical protein